MAALTYVRSGVLQREAYTDMYDKQMDLYLKREDNLPVQGQQFYTTEDADNISFRVTTTGTLVALPIEADDTEPVPRSSVAPGHVMDFTIPTLQQSIRITDTLLKLDRSGGRAADMISGLPRAGKRWLEYAFVDPINNGTTATGADSQFLFDNDHEHEDPAGGTYSNVETGAALSSTTLSAMYNNMQKRTNELGQISPITMQKIVVHVDNRKPALEIARSLQSPEDALNRANIFKDFGVMIWHHLTNSTAWFGWGDLPQTMWGLHYMVFTPPTVGKLALPGEDHPHIKAGFWLKIQVAAGGSLLKNMTRNAGA